MENMETEQNEKEKVMDYLNNNGLIAKWEPTGLFEKVNSNSKKYFIASIMESMIYASFEMCEKEGKSSEEMMAFQERYLAFMAELGVFSGDLLNKIQ
jgi:hypothetical protein